MVFLIPYFVSILLALTHYATAFPIDPHELIPGPGLPSLASLNLTTSDIVKLPLPLPLILTGKPAITPSKLENI
jgi:hypothetical protein